MTVVQRRFSAHAGPLQCGYDNGFLRRIAYGNNEVLRMIYFAVRDHNWNTMSASIENENVSATGEGVEITYDDVTRRPDACGRKA